MLSVTLFGARLLSNALKLHWVTRLRDFVLKFCLSQFSFFFKETWLIWHYIQNEHPVDFRFGAAMFLEIGLICITLWFLCYVYDCILLNEFQTWDFRNTHLREFKDFYIVLFDFLSLVIASTGFVSWKINMINQARVKTTDFWWCIEVNMQWHSYVKLYSICYTKRDAKMFTCVFSNRQDPELRPLLEKDSKSLEQLLPEIPFWIKNPDYERVSSNYFGLAKILLVE